MTLDICGRSIGKGLEPFLIAEVGINHNGDVDTALKMIDVARDCGVDCVKFQTFNADEFCGDKTQTYTYKSQNRTVTESMYEMFKRVELPKDSWSRIKRRCDDAGVVFMSTPQNSGDLDLLLDVGLPAIKVGSDDFVNLQLLSYYKTKDLPLILSCGMADLDEIGIVLKEVGHPDAQVALLLCTSEYPTPLQDVNLGKLASIGNAFPGLVLGFSDHTEGSLSATIAVGMGAAIFEKHFTLSHDLPGPDHWFSADPYGLCDWVKSIRSAYKALGSGLVVPTERELAMRKLARRRFVARTDIRPGDLIADENIEMKRAANGMFGLMYRSILGKRAVRGIAKGAPIMQEDIA